MCEKILILGRPGSGKSTAARHIHQRFVNQSLVTVHINDYPILQQMFHEDLARNGARFRATAHGGFDAIDLDVLDTALEIVEEKAQVCISECADAVTIEFARSEYHSAFAIFHEDFLRDAFILYLESSIEHCLERVHRRLAHPSSTDDHPSFSDEIFVEHYRQENSPYFVSLYETHLSKRVQIIDNNGSLAEFLEKIDRFVDDMMHARVERALCAASVEVPLAS